MSRIPGGAAGESSSRVGGRECLGRAVCGYVLWRDTA